MKLCTALLKNFVTHKNTAISFELDGSYFIYGDNKDNKSMDSNAVGKTLIIDAISWCLFGKTIRGCSADGIIGNFAKHAMVNVKIDKSDAEQYLISRYRNHPVHKNNSYIKFRSSDNDEWHNITKETTRDTDNFIVKVLGMSYDMFATGLIIVGTGDDANFCRARDSRRKGLLTSILNIEWIDKALLRVKKDLKTKRQEFAVVANKESAYVNRIDAIKEMIREYSKELKLFEETREEEITALKSKISEIKSEKVVKNKDTSNIDQKLARLRKDQIIASSRMRKIKTIELQCEKLTTQIQSYKSIISSIDGEKVEYMRLIQNCKKKDVMEGQICEACGALFSKENLDRLKKQLVKNIDLRDVKISSLIAKTQTFQKQLDILNDRLVNLLAKKSVDWYDEKMYELNEIKNKSVVEESRRAEVISNLNICRRDLKKIRSCDNPYPAKINRLKRKLSKLCRRRDFYKFKRISKQKEITRLEYWVDGFGNSGLKNDIISSRISLFEDKINHYLKMITGGEISVTLDNKVQKGSLEKIDIIIRDNRKKKPLPYEQWSGGERMRISFAVEWAKHDMIECPLNIVVVDEIATDGNDVTGIKTITEFLSSVTDKKVIFISNIISLKSLFDNALKVTMQNGISSVTLESKK